MSESLGSMKAGYVLRFILGISVMAAIGVALFFLYRTGKWWAWVLILLIGPAAFFYAIRQIPSELKTMVFVLSSKSVDEFVQRNELAAQQRENGGRNAAREHYGINKDNE